jgi:hypothetical protein
MPRSGAACYWILSFTECGPSCIELGIFMWMPRFFIPPIPVTTLLPPPVFVCLLATVCLPSPAICIDCCFWPRQTIPPNRSQFSIPSQPPFQLWISSFIDRLIDSLIICCWTETRTYRLLPSLFPISLSLSHCKGCARCDITQP